MREETGSIFEYPADVIVIPVNWTTKANGDAVMGAGVAKQAAERWPWLPRSLGQLIREFADRPVASGAWHLDGRDVVCVPTKRHWRDPADPALISNMVYGLVGKADRLGWESVALPRLGCGLGGLDWADVKPILETYLDDRFVVLTPESPS